MQQRRIELLKEEITKANKEKSIGAVADLGCGTGKVIYDLSNIFPFIRFCGYDMNERFIRCAQGNFNNRNLEFTCLNLESEMQMEEEYDFVYSIDFLHHLRILDRAIQNIHKMLKNGRCWLVIEPNIFNIYMALAQLLMKDERLFWQRCSEELFLDGKFQIKNKTFFLLIPSYIKNPPDVIRKLERRFEKNFFLGGSVVYVLQKCAI